MGETKGGSLSYDTAPAEIRRAKFPETSQKLYCVKKLYLRNNSEADFKDAEWEKYEIELFGSEKMVRYKRRGLY